MKKQLFFIMLWVPLFLTAQTTVKGIITEQNSGNKPIPGVQLKAIGTTPELSDNAGLFKLVFTAKKPGDRIIVSEISKKGYEIVNKDVVNNWLIPGNPNERTKIVMCPEGLIAQNTIKYYDISLAGLTKGYESRIKALEEQRDKALINAETFGEQAKTLEEQYGNQQKQLEELADKFARENFDDCSAIHKKAFELFKLGNIEEAVRILESINSEAEISKAKQQKGKAMKLVNESDSVISQNISKLIFQADLYSNLFRFDDAEKSYETAVNADSTNFNNICSYADYLLRQRKITESLNWNNRALRLAKTGPDKAKILLRLGINYEYLNQFEKAENSYFAALKLRREYATANPSLYNSDLSLTLISVAVYYDETNQIDKAEEILNEAINIFRELVKNDPANNNPKLAICLDNYAQLLVKVHKIDEAESDYKEALNIRRELVTLNPHNYNYNFDLTWTLFGLGQLKTQTKDYMIAESYYKEALTLMRDLVKSNNQAYSSYLARLLTGYGNLKNEMNQFEDAEAFYSEALKITEDLVNSNPLVNNVIYGISLSCLASVEDNMQKFDLAESNYNKAISLYRELVKISPQVYNKDLAGNLNNLAYLQLKILEYDKAETNYLEAIDLFRELARSDPDEFNQGLVAAQLSYATLLYTVNKSDKAETFFNEGMKSGNELAGKFPNLYQGWIANTYGNLSFLQIKNKRFALAETSVRKGLLLDSTQQWMITNLASALLFQGKFEEAKKIYMELKDKAFQMDPSKTYKDMFLADFDEFEKAGITHPDVAKIRELLKQ
ncbi:MAG: tetratricopeptide repeat protein [Bacteroidia bacterium]|nr:tetratricopeptide repeat protein [Bacteroidia bacterium]